MIIWSASSSSASVLMALANKAGNISPTFAWRRRRRPINQMEKSGSKGVVGLLEAAIDAAVAVEERRRRLVNLI